MKTILFKLTLGILIIALSGIKFAAAQVTSCPGQFSEVSRTETTLSCAIIVPDVSTLDDPRVADQEAVCTGANGTPSSSLAGFTATVSCSIPLSTPPGPEPNPEPEPAPEPGSENPPPTTPTPGPAPSAAAPSGPGSAKGKITDNPLILPGSYEFSVGSAIENLCPQLAFINHPAVAGELTPIQKDLLVRCGDVIFETGDQKQIAGVQNMSAEEFSSQSINLRRLNKAQLGNIAARLAALRPALSQSTQDLAVNQPLNHPLKGLAGMSTIRERGGAAGDDEIPEDASRLGVFINGIQSDGEKDESSLSSGFDYSGTGYTVGMDYLVDLNTVVGVAVGHGSTETEFGRGGGSLDADTTTLSLYGTRFINDSWFLDGVLGYGTSRYDSERNFNYTARGVTVDQTALGSPDSDQLLISVGAGKTINKQSVDVDITGRLNYLDAKIDRFAETIEGGDRPGFGLALEIDEQDVSSLTSDISVKISKAISQDFGVVIPQASLSWLHEFKDGDGKLRGRFVNDPFSVDFSQSGLHTDGVVPTIFEIPLDDTDSDYARLGLGVNVLLADGLTLNFQANKLFGLQDIDLEYYVMGVRKDL